MPVVTHLVSLTQAAGVEAHFSEFVRHARVSDPAVAHGWLNAAARHAPVHRRPRRAASSHTSIQAPSAGCRCRRVRSAARVALPPRACRGRHRRARDLESHSQERSSRSTRSASDAASIGSTVPRGTPGAKRAARISRARAARDRELDCGRARACVSAGTTAATCASAATRCGRASTPSAPVRSVTRTGGRSSSARPRGLYPVKGLAIVLHAVAVLAGRPPLDVELEVAGAGPELERLRRLAERSASRSKRDVSTAPSTTCRRSTRASIVCCTRRSRRRSGSSRSKRRRTVAPSSRRASTAWRKPLRTASRGDSIAPTLPLARYVELGGALDGACRSASTILPRDALREPRRRRSRALGRGGRRRVRGRRANTRRLSAGGERARARAAEFRRPRSRRHGSRRWLRCRRVDREPAGGDSVTVVLYRPSLDARSGAGQLLEMQWRGLTCRRRADGARVRARRFEVLAAHAACVRAALGGGRRAAATRRVRRRRSRAMCARAPGSCSCTTSRPRPSLHVPRADGGRRSRSGARVLPRALADRTSRREFEARRGSACRALRSGAANAWPFIYPGFESRRYSPQRAAQLRAAARRALGVDDRRAARRFRDVRRFREARSRSLPRRARRGSPRRGPMRGFSSSARSACRTRRAQHALVRARRRAATGRRVVSPSAWFAALDLFLYAARFEEFGMVSCRGAGDGRSRA